jgi:cell division protein FtsW (lipid II flippase)
MIYAFIIEEYGSILGGLGLLLLYLILLLPRGAHRIHVREKPFGAFAADRTRPHARHSRP